MKGDEVREKAREEVMEQLGEMIEKGELREASKQEREIVTRQLIPESKNAKSVAVKRNRDKGFVVPGDSSALAVHMLNFLTWESAENEPVEVLVERLKNYVEYCIENDIKMSNEACYMALGLGRDTIDLWLRGEKGSIEHHLYAKKLKQFLTANRELQMVEGKLHPIVGIWWQKNYDGLKDQQEVIYSSRDPLEDIRDVTEMEKKYLESVGIVNNPVPPPVFSEKDDD